jgi:hypothetical protein
MCKVCKELQGNVHAEHLAKEIARDKCDAEIDETSAAAVAARAELTRAERRHEEATELLQHHSGRNITIHSYQHRVEVVGSAAKNDPNIVCNFRVVHNDGANVLPSAEPV